MFGEIFCTINLINGKLYVGKTNRKRNFKTYMGSGKALKAAMQKYGKNNFKKITLETYDENADWSQLEHKWIQKLNSKQPFGYNLTDGGEGCPNFKMTKEQRQKCSEWQKGKPKKPFSPEHCKNLSKSTKGRKFSAEHCEKIRQWHLGRKNPNWKLSPEGKARISKANTGRKKSQKTREQISNNLKKYYQTLKK